MFSFIPPRGEDDSIRFLILKYQSFSYEEFRELDTLSKATITWYFKETPLEFPKQGLDFFKYF